MKTKTTTKKTTAQKNDSAKELAIAHPPHGHSVATCAEGAKDLHGRYVSLMERYGVQLRAVDPSRFSALNVDVPQALSTMHGVLPRLAAMRGQIVDELKSFDIERYDSIGDRTHLLEYAHARYLAATTAHDRLPELAERASKELAYMVLSARPLAAKGLVSGERLDEMQYVAAYRDRGSMLTALGLRLLDAWSAINGRTTLTLDEINGAIELGHEVLAAAGQRSLREDSCNDAADLRMRALTLLDEAYNDARRALRFVRDAYGDADELAPSLRTNTSVARRKPVEEGNAKPADEQPVAPTRDEAKPKEETKAPPKAPEKGSPA